MSALTYDISYAETRSRLTNAFRFILAIPHLIVMRCGATSSEILAFVQWFIIVFTGKRNQALWDLQWAWLGYAGRVYGYANLMFDPYPEFGTAPGAVPVSIDLGYERAGRPADERPAVHLGDPGAADRTRHRHRLLGHRAHLVVRHRHHRQAPRGLFDFSLRSLRFRCGSTPTCC